MSRADTNELWARGIAARWLPNKLFRWELYESAMAGIVKGPMPWLDLGCGDIDFTSEFRAMAYGIGLDRRLPQNISSPFIRADLAALPVRSDSMGAVCLRFVLEHLSSPEEIWTECRRVLVPGGRVLVITTNSFSPLVMLARLLPVQLKRFLIETFFGATRESVLPVYHRWNTPGRIKRPPEGFELERIEFVEALNWHRRFIFRLLLCMAALTRNPIMQRFRSNILAVYIRVEGKNG